jgi:F0F1-type ATP synthase membrane subunit b/b'
MTQKEAPAEDRASAAGGDLKISIPNSGAYRLPETEQFLRRSIDLVNNARPLPMSTTIRINRDEIGELLNAALEKLPDELRRARWLLKEREEFLARTRREADDILDQARARAERMVQRTEVVKAAEMKARKLLEAADEEARRVRLDTEDYCDQRLASFEIVLDKTLKMVSAGRARLQGTGGAAAGGPQPTAAGKPLALPEPGDPPVFDQDLG